MLKQFFSPFKLAKPLLFLFVTFSALTRIALIIYADYNDQIDINYNFIIKLFAYGLVNDLATFTYFICPIAIITCLIPSKVKSTKTYKYIGYAFLYLWIYILCFNAVAEVIFWEEFGARYNFIAVDYLVYTQEVIGNIYQSYPLITILISLFIFSLITFCCFFKSFKALLNSTNYLQRNIIQAGCCALIMLLIFFVYKEPVFCKTNRYANELSKNGIYNLFSAFRNNILNFEQFYKVLPLNQALDIVKKSIGIESQNSSNDTYSIARNVISQGKIHNYNIILITVESLSADYLERFGNKENLTPNLGSLIKKSLLFDNFYATGTRTVRGLEAIMLSIPPMPGNSIVRRPNNEDLYSLGSVLLQQNYSLKFIYGGYGYFDNMNYFFENNGFNIIDRNKIADNDINFANVWGVCDEDLFDQTIREADKSFASNDKFFSLVLTTSNHRPYTYPSGKIDIASGTGRNGAVKYTDYAIGEFIAKASKKDWFDNTIFIITADHCAASAGKTEIPIDKYHIPLIIYAPKIIKPGQISNLSSQIDLAPTILGLINVSYESNFFGDDIIKNPKNRAFLGTYQQLAMLKTGKFVIISPQQKVNSFKVELNNSLVPIEKNDEMVNEAISYYQLADYLYAHGLLKNKLKFTQKQ
jgi:phosphoglycerol transferase MdoB-like AlkP superfamily enzyme